MTLSVRKTWLEWQVLTGQSLVLVTSRVLFMHVQHGLQLLSPCDVINEKLLERTAIQQPFCWFIQMELLATLTSLNCFWRLKGQSVRPMGSGKKTKRLLRLVVLFSWLSHSKMTSILHSLLYLPPCGATNIHHIYFSNSWFWAGLLTFFVL